jgi:hypothetical protein
MRDSTMGDRFLSMLHSYLTAVDHEAGELMGTFIEQGEESASRKSVDGRRRNRASVTRMAAAI